MAVRSRVGAFAEAVAGPSAAQILGFLRELSGESAYYRYVDGQLKRRFTEGSIMTRPEYERWRPKPKSNSPEIRC